MQNCKQYVLTEVHIVPAQRTSGRDGRPDLFPVTTYDKFWKQEVSSYQSRNTSANGGFTLQNSGHKHATL